MAENNRPLSPQDIDPEYLEQVTTQSYAKKPVIEGVQVVPLNIFGAEDGYFLEMARLDGKGNLLALPDFNVRQISYSSVMPGGIKAWHIHYKQEDVWFIPPDSSVLLGLCDLRKDSPTCNTQMRLTLGNHKAQLVLIPRGVAHGCANVSGSPINMIYFTNEVFNSEDPDEHRLPWDFFGSDFWEVKNG